MRFRAGLWVAIIVLAIGDAVSVGVAQDTPSDPVEDPNATVVDRWADAMAEAFAPRWAGPRVDWPSRFARPVSGGVLRGALEPVNVQLGAGASWAQGRAALAALEEAHDWMEARRWPLPPPDGGRGETTDFDLYLAPVDPAPEGAERSAAVSWDAPLAYGGLDAVTSFGVVAPNSDLETLSSCAISTYVQAALLAADPAEAEAWRVATGDYVAWLLRGRFGCGPEGLIRQQTEPWRTWISADPQSGAGGALFLAMLSARTDGLTGDFIRDLWSGAPQLTWEGDRLRAAPDMWQVVNVVMNVGQDPLERLLEEFAVARYFVGPPERSRGAPLPFLQSLPAEAVVPIAGVARFDALPRRFEPHDLELEPWGSAYLWVDTSMAPAGSTLRIWLRGELGVGWSLVAVRMGADGEERGRVRSPVRPLNPRSYIPLELTDDQTASVLLVVTNMGARLVDADEPDDQVRSFRVILDHG